MSEVKVSVIGVGFWGRNHARVISELEDAVLEAIYDLNPSVAQRVAERFKCHVASSLEEAIRRSDAVTICTPTSTHYEIALKVIREGRHLLVEKPMTMRSIEALKLISEAEKRGVLLTVGHIERFNMGVHRLLELVEKGSLGEVLSIRAKRVSGGAGRITDVGVMLDLAIHDLDLAMFILRDKPKTIYSIAGRRLSTEHEDYAYVMISMQGGGQVYVESSWLTKSKVRLMEVTGTNGVATLNFLTQEVSVVLGNEEFKLSGEWVEPLKLELENFVKSVRGYSKPLVSAVDGYRALKCAELALKSSELGRPVEVEFEL
ncbi:MAG: hypothetical protein DRJ62_07185 [Thermoprotei archaeon]|nr:MAG: hypothetical protein DRJ62_07185 [Thermoprotei archaeon]